MDIAWPTLIQVRERHQRAAQEAVAQERRETVACEARLAAADAQWRQEIEARASLWQRLREPTDGALNVAQLSQASAWSRTLDGRIARAGDAVVAARRRLAQQEERLAASRQRLRDATGELSKAEQMQQRDLQARRRAAELRRDDRSEESATLVWRSRGR
jgi:hypothetical protein